MGGLLGSMALRLGVLVLAVLLRDSWVLLLYLFRTVLFLPLAGLAGAALGAGIVCLGGHTARRRLPTG